MVKFLREFDIMTTADTDDPILIAVDAFNGTETSAHLWRKYFHTLIGRCKDINKAQDLFLEAIYVAKREIESDKLPDIFTERNGKYYGTHIHAKYFTKIIKKILNP